MIDMSQLYDAHPIMPHSGNTVEFRKFEFKPSADHRRTRVVENTITVKPNTFKEHMIVAKSDPVWREEYDKTIQASKITMEQQMGVNLDNYLMSEIVKQVKASMAVKPVLEHKCNGCGATVKMDIDNHIFWCEYCGRTYAIGTTMINDKGD